MISTQELYRIFQKHSKIFTDTRKPELGGIFFALRGDNFDGNRFAAQALAAGAAYAVIDDPAVQTDPRYLLVPDTLKALQELANLHRKQFLIPIIAIGGSNGKTTTKELISAVLSSQYPCHFTQGNLNNHIGVPLTLLAMPPQTEVAVVEMGANHAGDIAELCRIAEPTHGVITNIGKEHLEGFQSIEGVKKAEGELYTFLRKNGGWAFVNGSEKYLRSMSGRTPRLLYLETKHLQPNDHELEVQFTGCTPFVSAAFLDENGQEQQIQSQLPGRHNFHNIMTAIALGIYFKVPGKRIKAAIEAYKPANNRSQIIQKGSNTILLDAYNANPSSMMAALETLRDFAQPHKVAILGDMLELGAESRAEHEAILRFAAKMGFDDVVLIGPEFGHTPFKKFKARHFADTASAADWFRHTQFENAALLLKGSRGMRLESLLSQSA